VHKEPESEESVWYSLCCVAPMFHGSVAVRLPTINNSIAGSLKLTDLASCFRQSSELGHTHR